MDRNPTDQATFVLQVFSHLCGTKQQISTGQRYLVTLISQFRDLGIHHEYLLKAVNVFAQLESDLATDVDKLNNKLARIDLSDKVEETGDETGDESYGEQG